MNNLLRSSYYEGDKYENNNKVYATEGKLKIYYIGSIKALQDTQVYLF